MAPRAGTCWRWPLAGPWPVWREDIAFAPVWAQQAWLSSGALTSVELTEIYLSRIERHAPLLECFVTVTRERALDCAEAMDRERARGHVRGALHGIPYALKDIIDVAGLPATWGATPYRDRVAETTASVATRLDAAGAVLLGKTTLGALAYGDVWFGGQTRNPFNTEEGSSGSSAGSAAAVAAGLASFAIGTETMGSIVSPAHRCGATGLRPTFGRVARDGAMALCWSLDKIGPLVRSANDAALVLAVMNGDSADDPASLAHGFEMDFDASPAGLRVGYDPAWFEDAPQPDRDALEAARAVGVELVEISIPQAPHDGLLITLESEAAAAFEHLTLDNVDDALRWQEPAAWPNTWRRARFASAVDLVNADRFRRQLIEEMHLRFAELDAIIGPNFAGDMLLLTNFTGHPQMTFRSGFVQRQTRTLFGEVADESSPAVEVPMTTSVWGPLFEEGRLVTLAQAIENELGVAQRRPDGF
jgi:Asp-tRNA(Asn)/Glu-tRNA(Gln) amidotransferase A subunit family amidase